ncbi:MAG: isoprenylcysteine carboxylmethyltransferase family protein, partial [Elusimicrobia bacterium]|nr:isoprenylcysteine carboxylmethyltransferase family protein [Elusimicrobiota bacterium]
MNPETPPISPWWERYRVRIGFLFGLLFLWRVQPRNIFFLVVGLGISFLGILLRQWAAGCVKKMDELATSGPYAVVRHPLYAGSFLAAVGLLIASSSFSLSLSKPYLDRTLFFWTFFWILIDSVYWPKIHKEEKELQEKFPQEYLSYENRVPRLLPAHLRWSDIDFSTFQWFLWKKNKEFYSLIGYGAMAIILI